ncbi:hypothetical protein TNCV_1466961 [Trichonephila clavipes]|nr:hypothetical protein TNCV_1466961 [Trichonephila clavipes]
MTFAAAWAVITSDIERDGDSGSTKMYTGVTQCRLFKPLSDHHKTTLPAFDIGIMVLNLHGMSWVAERLVHLPFLAITVDEVGHRLEAAWSELLIFYVQARFDSKSKRERFVSAASGGSRYY